MSSDFKRTVMKDRNECWENCASFNSHELVGNAQGNKYHELVFKIPEGVGEGGYGPAT